MNKVITLFFRYYLPAIIWAGVIFLFSGIPDLKVGAESIRWEIIWRKAAHIGEYALLFWLFWRLFYYGHNFRLKYSLFSSLLLTLAYSIGDEFHQTLTPGRTGRIVDVVLDMLSAFLVFWSVVFYKSRRFKKTSFFLFFVTLAVIFGLEQKMIREGETMEQKNKQAEEILIKEKEGAKEEKELAKEDDIFLPEEKKEEKEESVPGKMKINVPFTSQAPFANWDEYHEEACEEASVIMIKFYLDGKKLDKETAEEEIQAIIKFQKKNYGDYKDTSAKETVKLTQEFYGLSNLKVVYDFKKEDIKKHLAQNKPIIIPAAGRMLGNPNFTPPGPLYHNLVLTGYDGDTIITNDPGTRKGEGYKYDIDVLYQAIHDFPGKKEDIERGRKAMIVVE